MADRGWCPTCRSMSEVEETFTDGAMTARGEETYTVTVFECGHDSQSPGRITAPAPGAPYAGGITAATIRDVGDARTRQARMDRRDADY